MSPYCVQVLAVLAIASGGGRISSADGAAVLDAPVLHPLSKLNLVAPGKPAVPDEYIVTVNPHNDLQEHLNKITDLLGAYGNSSVLNSWKIAEWFAAYHIRTPFQDLLKEIVLFSEVQAVESNAIFKASCSDHINRNWGAVRIQSSHPPDYDLNRWYRMDQYNGAGVSVYLVDSGVTANEQFDHVNIRWGLDTKDEPSPETDENGHGTAMAGIICSKSVGMATGVDIVVVRVLDENMCGIAADLLTGLKWITDDYIKQGRPHSIVNLSINMDGLQVGVTTAVEAVINSGIPLVCSAGNDNVDACRVTPNGARNVISVGATTKDDGFSSISNHGRCVDILAPGERILTTTREAGTMETYGTSGAAAHVTAVLARRIQATGSHDVGKVRGWLYEMNSGCTSPAIAGLPARTPARLLYGPCDIDR